VVYRYDINADGRMDTAVVGGQAVSVGDAPDVWDRLLPILTGSLSGIAAGVLAALLARRQTAVSQASSTTSAP
jgi:hypothetical protein